MLFTVVKVHQSCIVMFLGRTGSFKLSKKKKHAQGEM